MSDEVVPFLPKNVINIPFTATSTSFQSINDTSGTRLYAFTASTNCFVRRGPSTVSAATTTDLRMRTNIRYYFALRPGEGVRVIRSTDDGILQIGDTEV